MIPSWKDSWKLTYILAAHHPAQFPQKRLSLPSPSSLRALIVSHCCNWYISISSRPALHMYVQGHTPMCVLLFLFYDPSTHTVAIVHIVQYSSPTHKYCPNQFNQALHSFGDE